MLNIGSHVSYSKNGLLGSVEEALSYGSNTFMFYTGAPTNTIRKDIDIDIVNKAKELMINNKIDINKVICHAPYIVNLASKSSIDKWEFSCNFIREELNRCEILGVKYMVLHPGSAVNISKEEGLNNIIEALNKIIKSDDKCMILLETMAGKGSECNTNLEELKYIIDHVSNVGVCLDTCHLNDSGVDISKFDEYLDLFDKMVGIDKIKCVHINDSKNIIGAHKDRHENIGFGTIGFNNLLNVIYNKRLEGVPMILETPYIGDYDGDKNRLYPPYKFEIEMIRNKEFDNDVLNKIRKYYK